MTTDNTTAVKLRVRRRRLRQLAPELAEHYIAEIAIEDNPVVRIGLLLDAVSKASLPVSAVKRARRETLTTAAPEVDAAVKLLDDPSSRRGRAAAIGLLGLRRGRELAGDSVEDGYVSPDDRGYRPTQRDKLLHGPGRATGVAARAVKRRTTYAKWQVDI